MLNVKDQNFDTPQHLGRRLVDAAIERVSRNSRLCIAAVLNFFASRCVAADAVFGSEERDELRATVLMESVGKLVGTEPSKAVYDVFLRLVPLHLAVAPPKGSKWTTAIDKKYTEFCECDKVTPEDGHDCCGPSVGAQTLRQRLIGPQPYLVEPQDYFNKVICCLVEKHYLPAKDALAKAEADLLTVENQIKRYKAQIENGLKSFEKDAKAAIPTSVKCDDSKLKKPAEEGEPGR